VFVKGKAFPSKYVEFSFLVYVEPDGGVMKSKLWQLNNKRIKGKVAVTYDIFKEE
jgi:hypothetical protein